MPHLRVRAVPEQAVQKLSETLISDLAKLVGSPEDNFTLESVGSSFFAQGKRSEAYPFIEVWWFDRPQVLQDQVAKLITDQVRALTQALDIVVVFQIFNKTAYYENGEHF